MKKIHALLLLCVLPLPLVGGCISHEVRIEPITFEPIHMTLDVNLHVDHQLATATEGGESPAPSADTSAAPTPAQ